MKPITLLILFQIIASASFSQEATEKEEGVDAISLLSMTIPEANKLLGKPSKIKRGPFTQPFCGMSRGRDEMLTYKKHHVVIETRKKLGYEKRVDLRTSNSKRYYKNCSVWSLKISAKSKLTIDALALHSIDATNVDSKLEVYATKLENNQYITKTDNGAQYLLNFIFQDEKLKEVTIERYYDLTNESK